MLLSTMFLVRNFFSGLVIELSSMEVAATSASEVSLNFPNAFNLTLTIDECQRRKIVQH